MKEERDVSPPLACLPMQTQVQVATEMSEWCSRRARAAQARSEPSRRSLFQGSSRAVLALAGRGRRSSGEAATRQGGRGQVQRPPSILRDRQSSDTVPLGRSTRSVVICCGDLGRLRAGRSSARHQSLCEQSGHNFDRSRGGARRDVEGMYTARGMQRARHVAPRRLPSHPSSQREPS